MRLADGGVVVSRLTIVTALLPARLRTRRQWAAVSPSATAGLHNQRHRQESTRKVKLMSVFHSPLHLNTGILAPPAKYHGAEAMTLTTPNPT